MVWYVMVWYLICSKSHHNYTDNMLIQRARQTRLEASA